MNSNRVMKSALLLAVLLGSTAAFAAEPKQDSDDAKLRQELAEAQRRMDKAAREVAELSRSLSKDAMARVVSTRGGQRAVLGIGIGTDEDDEDNDEGVEVLSVSPGGAAADAGVKSGDVLLALNDKSLKRDDDGSPRSKLLEVMRTVKPGDKVSIKYKRGDRTRAVVVVTKPLTERFYGFGPDFGGKLPEIPDIPSMAIRRVEGVLGSAELVALTPKLGEYFGTEKGLLVIRAPTDSRLELEEGDVIVEIDGRTPTSPAHAARILASYSAGETVKFNVLRKRRRTSVEFEIPEDAPRARFERDRPEKFERFQRPQNLPARPYQPRGTRISPPAPPAAPTPAAAPLPAPAPLPALPPIVEIQALPDEAVKVDEVY